MTEKTNNTGEAVAFGLLFLLIIPPLFYILYYEAGGFAALLPITVTAALVGIIWIMPKLTFTQGMVLAAAIYVVGQILAAAITGGLVIK